MEIELGDVSGIPDAIKALVTDRDGKNYLNLAQLAPASEVDRFKGKAMTAEQEAIDRRKALRAWEAFGTPDEITAKLAKGADPAIVKALQDKLAETETGYKAKMASVLRDRAISDLKAELSKAGVVPEGLDLLAAYAAPRIAFDDDGGMRVMSDDGKTPMIGKATNGGATLADLAEKLAGSIPHLVADKGNGGGGKPPSSTGGMPTPKMTLAEFNAIPSAKERAAIMAKGTTLIE